MTEGEIDADIGRLARKYAEINKRIVCTRDRLNDHESKLETLRGAINLASQEKVQAPKDACAAIDWEAVCRDATRLPDLAAEREKIENCLRETRVTELILPTWKK